MDVLNKLSSDWEDLKEVVVYGFGRVAQRNIGKINKDFQIKYIVDNNPALGIHQYEGIQVRKLESVKKDIVNYKVLVATSTLAYESIAQQLQDLGMEEYQDFCRWEDFLPEWYWKYKGQVCVSQIFSTVTSKCTFKCKYCSMLMPEYKEHYMYDENDILADFDALFKRIDYLTSYYVIGGEPLVNKKLWKILEAVYDKYTERIGYMQIITNGTIVPDEQLLRVMKKCNVNVRISDYTHAISYQNKLNEVIEVLKENEIDYAISKYETWVDLGFPHEDVYLEGDNQMMKAHMLNCAKGCHSMNDKKLYYCGLLYASEKLGKYKLRDTDYIELENITGNIQEDKEEILRYFLGDVKEEFISLCRICRGQGTDNPCVIPVAEQVK